MININPSLQALIPPLSADEFSLLQNSIISEGCRDPIVLWGDTIVDGHNRFAICTAHGIPFDTVSMEFESIAHARVWMRNNQLGRRNLNDGWRVEMVAGNKDDLLAIGREKQSDAGGDKKSQDYKIGFINNDKPSESHNTQKILAEQADMSTGKYAQAEIVRRESPDLWEKVKSDEITIGGAYRELKEGGEARKQDGKFHISEKNNDWYTPPYCIEAARAVMGSIDLDPASSDLAQKTVKAGIYYTIDDDGLAHDWSGNVWMNPPYSMPEIQLFVDKLLDSDIKQWIVLTNNSSDTGWFHQLLYAADYVCLTKGRVGFVNQEEETMLTRQGQAFFYHGENTEQFIQQFSKLGAILRVEHEHSA